MSAVDAALYACLISSGSAIILAIISRLRFRCQPDKETGKCYMISGCSEVPLPGADEDEITCHSYDLNGKTTLIVTARGEKKQLIRKCLYSRSSRADVFISIPGTPRGRRRISLSICLRLGLTCPTSAWRMLTPSVCRVSRTFSKGRTESTTKSRRPRIINCSRWTFPRNTSSGLPTM